MKIIKIYSNLFINSISLIIAITIFFSCNFIFDILIDNNTIKNEKINSKEYNSEKINPKKINEYENKSELEEIKKEYNWYIEIPFINLIAPIEESTEMNVLNRAVGHFEETSLTNGNIGLAGHNREYEKNFFENLKNVKKGEIIKYKYNQFEKTYVIDLIKTIKETNWQYLENTKENKITLITCVENKPEYRICVQATEKIE